MTRTDEMINARAVKIAARLMANAGMCRYDDRQQCKSEKQDCTGCIKRFLRGKARAELVREGKIYRE